MLAKVSLTKSILVLFLLLFLVSCGGSKRAISSTTNAKQITDYAQVFINTPYRYGGTTSQGMDCSGLIYQVFLKHGKQIPRTTKGLSSYGQKIKLKQTRVGDLLFFKTSKKSGKINHVALVISKNGNQIEFIHSTTSRGVIVSEIDEKYWSQAYKFARRIL